jgi:hypothetical protein
MSDPKSIGLSASHECGPGETIHRAAKLHLDGRKGSAVAFVEQLLPVAAGIGHLYCSLARDDALRFESKGRLLCEVELLAAKGKLRMVCARLAVICQEHTGRELQPYGDDVSFASEALPDRGRWHIRFVNTTSKQEFDIETLDV